LLRLILIFMLMLLLLSWRYTWFCGGMFALSLI
jgi:hypothetical protein